MHAGAAVCLCFAPLEISMHALCDLQRDDKLKGRSLRLREQRTEIQTQRIVRIMLQMRAWEQRKASMSDPCCLVAFSKYHIQTAINI